MKAPAVGVSAERAATALEAWFDDEIKGRTERYFDLGKFLFGASTGTIAFFTTAVTALGEQSCSRTWLLVCALSSVAGIVLSLVMLWPRNIQVGASLDLVNEFNATLLTLRLILAAWFVLFVVGLASGSLSLIDGSTCSWLPFHIPMPPPKP